MSLTRMWIASKVARELGLSRTQKEGFHQAWREAERQLDLLPGGADAATKAAAVEPALHAFLATLDAGQRSRAEPLLAQARARWGAVQADPSSDADVEAAEAEPPPDEAEMEPEEAPEARPTLSEEDLEAEAMAYAEGRVVSLIDHLEASGPPIPDPDTLSDEALPGELADLIARMAAARIYLGQTNHLSDRGVFEFLVHEGLRGEYPEQALAEDSHIELSGLLTDSEDRQILWLAFYATDEQRELARRRGFHPPPRREFLSDRDQRLPRPGTPSP